MYDDDSNKILYNQILCEQWKINTFNHNLRTSKAFVYLSETKYLPFQCSFKIFKRGEKKKRDKFLLKSIRNKRFIIDICYIYGPWSFNTAAFDVCLNKFNKRQRVKIPVSTIYCDILWSKFKWQYTLLKNFQIIWCYY